MTRRGVARAVQPTRSRKAQPVAMPDAGSVVRAMAGSFRSALNPRRRSRTVDGSGDDHLDEVTRRDLRAQSRDLERNADTYDGLLTNWSTFLVGSGPRPVWSSQDREWSRRAADLFAADAAAKRLDGQRRLPWAAWVAMLARSVVRDGDAGLYEYDDGSAAIIESERVTEVRTDDFGRITGIRVAAAGRGIPAAGTGRLYAPDRCHLLAWRTRASQLRGHPALAAGLDDWERLDSLNEAEIIAAEASSLVWLVLKSAQGATPPVLGGNGSAAAGPTPQANWQRTDAASILGLPPGIDGSPWSPERPNLDVPAFHKLVLRHLCQPLIPYEVAFLDVGDLNYAAIRGVGRLANRRLADFRGHILEAPLSSQVNRWARAAMIAGRLPYVRDYHVASWQWDEIEIRDREKDATADEKEMANGTMTLRDRIGPQWEKHLDQLAAERDAKRRRGLLPVDPGHGVSGAPSPAPAPLPTTGA